MSQSEAMPRMLLMGLLGWTVGMAGGALPVHAGETDAYRDCGNGTVSDPSRDLVWEKKQDSGTGPDPSRPHEVANTYTWTEAPKEPVTWRERRARLAKKRLAGASEDSKEPMRVKPNGTLFTVFLASLNRPDPLTGECFAGRCDWRIPTMAELELLRVRNCRDLPCGNPVVGPSANARYWSSLEYEGWPEYAWASKFFSGNHNRARKTTARHARAVRDGDCDH